MKLKDAQVITSKFLQLKDKMDNAIAQNIAARSSWKEPSPQEIAYNVAQIQKAFGELCELLHEMSLDES